MKKNDNNTNIQELKDLLKDFRDKRDWSKFHNPKDLAEAISVEAGELLELFLWQTKEEVLSKMKNNPEFRKDVEKELADIVIFCINFANASNVDMSKIVRKKIKNNDKKYSVKKARELQLNIINYSYMQKLILQPCGSDAAREHFENTINGGYPLEEIEDYLGNHLNEVERIAQNGRVEIWGVVPGNNDINIGKYERTDRGDLVLFSANNKIFYIAQLAHKLHNRELAELLWGVNANGQTWEYVYFLIGGTNDDMSVSDLNNLIGFDESYVIRGFSVVNEEKTRAVIELYGNLENALSEIGSNFVMPTDEDIDTINNRFGKLDSADDVNSALNALADKIKGKRAQEKTKIIRALVRNRKIVELIKRKHNYKCQMCGYGGFEKRNGGKYAEAHHKEELAVSRWDHPDNMLCVCANCHRKLHYGQ